MTASKSLPLAVYAGIWIAGVLIVVLSERDVFPSGYAANEEVVYVLNLLAIACTLGGVYVALKWFHLPFVSRRLASASHAVGLMRRLDYVRMALMAVVLCGDLVVYYATLTSQGGFCALIAALALVFCRPTPASPRRPHSQP